MSAAQPGIPQLIEQQLLALDKQIRDVAFIRGAARTVLGVCLFLGCGLLIDGLFGLNNTIREFLLAGWFVLAIYLLWRGIVRPAIAPVSLSSLAAMVEQEFPELKERLTSLVELRGNEGTELAPGASRLMQDLLARQTVKALDKISLEGVASNHGPFRAALAGAASLLLLIAPFAWNGDAYGLLWSRFFIPWGNFAWGTNLELKVTEADQVVARGSDVPIHVTLTDRRGRREIEKQSSDPLWLNWKDDAATADRRRLDWDEESKSYMTVLPHLQRSVTFDVTTNSARSRLCKITVADPPVVTQFKLEIEPAPYTGLPAKILTGVPAEVRVTEFSRIQVQVEFEQSVTDAELVWPAETPNVPETTGHSGEKAIPIPLAADKRSGIVNVTADVSGPFLVRATNSHGLHNREPSRMLVVVPDQPPVLKLSGTEDPVLVRPDDVVEQSIEVQDDYGLSAVEFHLETSTGVKHVQPVETEQLRGPNLLHTFNLDLAQFALTGGQVVTYRVRVADNRPFPEPHEVWSRSRSLMTNTSLKQIPDRELAAEAKSIEDDINSLRSDIAEAKAEMAKLHEQIEKESLNQQAETDKTEKLTALQQAQDRLIEKLEQLSDRLAERPMTRELAPSVDQIGEQNLKVAKQKLEQSRDQSPRDQLEPVAQAIDHNGAADRQLQKLERQLNEINKLEQDLAELTRLAQNAERVAQQLEKLDADLKKADNGNRADSQQPAADQSQPKGDQQGARSGSPSNETAQKLDEIRKQNETLQTLKEAGKKIADQMDELIKKHPELIEAAKRDREDQLNRLAEQARQLAEPQQRLADSLKQQAEDSPAVASRPENGSQSDEASTKDSPRNDPKSDPGKSQPNQNPQSSDGARTKPTPEEQGMKAAQTQEQIAKEATQQAMDLAQKIGADAPATKAAAEFAKKADAAKQNVQSGQLPDAARQAREAQAAAEQSRDQLNNEGESKSSESKKSQELADRQRDNAKQLEQLSQSPEAARGAQMQGQKQRADATKQIAEKLDDVAKSLKSAPLNASQSAESAERASSAANKAKQAMEQSRQASQKNDAQKAAQEAAKAAESLKQAASEAKPAPKQSSPVPPKTASKVAEAMKQATAAQQKLSQCQCNGSCSNPSSSGSSGSSSSGSKPGSQGSPQQSASEGSKPSSSGQKNGPPNNALQGEQTPKNGQGDKPNPAGQAKPASASEGNKPSSTGQKNGPPNNAQQGEQTPKNGQGDKPNPAGQAKPTSASEGNKPSSSGQKNGPPNNAQQGEQTPKNGQGDKPNPDGQAKPEKSSTQSDSKQSESAGGQGTGPNQSVQNEPQIGEAAELFRELAAMLRQARGDLKPDPVAGKPFKSEQPGKPIDSDSRMQSEPGEAGGNAMGTKSAPDLSHLDIELQQQARSNWGRLPGQLRTEILQGAGKKSHPEYTQRIKSYFDEITKPAK